MAINIQHIRNSFKAACPEGLFYVCKHAKPGGSGSYYGKYLLELELKDEDWLIVYQLSRSSGSIMDDNEVRQKVFPFIDNTRTILDITVRRDLLRDALKYVFPNHNVNIFIYEKDWQNAYYGKGSASFIDECGLDVCIVLS